MWNETGLSVYLMWNKTDLLERMFLTEHISLTCEKGLTIKLVSLGISIKLVYLGVYAQIPQVYKFISTEPKFCVKLESVLCSGLWSGMEI